MPSVLPSPAHSRCSLLGAWGSGLPRQGDLHLSAGCCPCPASPCDSLQDRVLSVPECRPAHLLPGSTSLWDLTGTPSSKPKVSSPAPKRAKFGCESKSQDHTCRPLFLRILHWFMSRSVPEHFPSGHCLCSLLGQLPAHPTMRLPTTLWHMWPCHHGGGPRLQGSTGYLCLHSSSTQPLFRILCYLCVCPHGTYCFLKF